MVEVTMRHRVVEELVDEPVQPSHGLGAARPRQCFGQTATDALDVAGAQTGDEFAEPNLEPVEAAVWVAADVDDALRFFADDAGPSLRAIASDRTVSAVAETLGELLAPYLTSDGVRLPAAGWVVTSSVRRTR
jgi:hypothetical protein